MDTNHDHDDTADDLEELRKARAEDDGTRIPLEEFLNTTDK